MIAPFETKAKIVADTVSPLGVRITTFEVEAPRYLLAEVNTHRVIARSAASSRAIPVEKRIKMVQDHPYVPQVFGKNKPGMTASEVLSNADNYQANAFWIQASEAATEAATRLSAIGVHKQQANRLLEPFCGYTGVMTGTEWDNFFKLRAHADADPGFEVLARKMLTAYETNTPRKSDFHLPYVDDFASGGLEQARQISAARCARVSYRTFDGQLSTPEKDAALCVLLVSSGHLSPFDHIATADSAHYDDIRGGTFWNNPDDQRHLFGWVPYRVEVENKLGVVCARNSYSPLETSMSTTI